MQDLSQAMVELYHCVLENITISVACKTESVIATDHELSVGVSSKDPVRHRRNFFVHIALSTVRHDEVALHC